jgi:hypothetical protein
VRIPDLLVKVRMTFELTAGRPTTARADQDADVSAVGDHFSDPYDAWDAAIEALSCIPGLPLPDGGLDDWPEDDLVEITVDGTPVSLNLSHDDDGWALDINVDDESANLTCSYDPDARVWDSPEPFDRHPPYTLHSSEQDTPGRAAAWALAAWILAKL